MVLPIRGSVEKHLEERVLRHLRSFSWISALILLCLMSINILAITDSQYVGINNGTGYDTTPSYVDWSISKDKELGVGSVRMGMDNVGGYREGEAFNFGHRDVAVDKYLAANIAIHTVISARGHVNRDSDYEKWKANWSYFCKNVMTHYKGKISWYIIDNETDISYGNGTLSPQQAVDLTKIAFEIAKSIDPNIVIESPPPTSPETPYLREMISLGIANYCDYIGVHAYGGQINEGRLNRVWQYLQEFGVKKPVVVSEAGAINDYFNNVGVTPSEGRRIWFSRFYYQLKRYGYSHVLLFDLDKHDAWALIDTPAYNEIKNWYRNDPFANGGFEDANDNEHGWNVFASADIFRAPSTIKFIRDDAANAHTGSGYLQMEPGANSVRRLAEQLTPNKTYEIKAWVNITGGGTARLRALGWNHLDGDAEVAVTTTNSGWQELSLQVTPTKSWVVIDLGIENVGGNVRWDDVTIDESTGTGTPTPTPTPEVGNPDLVVTDISWTPANPVAGNQVTFSATIKNQGKKSTPIGVVHGVAFFVDGNFVSWSDTSSESLAPGASRTVTSNGGPGGTPVWMATAGTHTVEAHVDDINRIPGEEDESNNKLQETFTVGDNPTGVNLLINPGFEVDAKITNVITGWSAWSSNNLVTHGTWTPEGRGSNYFAYQWQSVPYSAWTYQRKTGLANGLYTLRAWIRNSGGQQEAQMGAVVSGGQWIHANIPPTWNWTQITIKDIPVTDGIAEVGFWSVAEAYQEINFDDVEFFKQ
jgi:hypothetical protein